MVKYILLVLLLLFCNFTYTMHKKNQIIQSYIHADEIVAIAHDGDSRTTVVSFDMTDWDRDEAYTIYCVIWGKGKKEDALTTAHRKTVARLTEEINRLKQQAEQEAKSKNKK